MDEKKKVIQSFINGIFPFGINQRANKKITERINREGNFSYDSLSFIKEISSDEQLASISIQQLDDLYRSEISRKEKLEDKAKINIAGVTISVSLVLGASKLGTALNAKFQNGFLSVLFIILFILSALYMVLAGCYSLNMIMDKNTVSFTSLGIDQPDETKKKELLKCIDFNRGMNTIRNNYIFTSYRCIQNSLILLFVVMVVVIMPSSNINGKASAISTNNAFYYESTIDSGITVAERQSAEQFIIKRIQKNNTGSLQSTIDAKDNLFVQYKYDAQNNRILIKDLERYQTP